MKTRKLLLIGVIAAVTLASWRVYNRPVDAPAWTGPIEGLAYSPMRPGQNPVREEFPSEAEIAADIAIIADHARSLRSYSLDGTLAAIPEIAADHGLEVTAGVWLDDDRAANRERLDVLARVVAASSNVTRVIVGNETLLTGQLTAAELAGYLNEIRTRLDVPVSTAEPWHIWLAHPEIAGQVDFLAVHLLPYWEGVPALHAVTLVESRMQDLARTYPGLPIVIGEVGWPSNGRSRGAAAASPREAEEFLRHFLPMAAANHYDYFLMEAFDQPWKRAEEGEVGAYWGLFDGHREAKYALAQTLIPVRGWQPLALLAAAVGALSFLLLAVDSRAMRFAGLGLLAAVTTTVANAAVLTLHDYLQQYWTPASLVGGIVLMIGMLGIVLLVFIEAHEWAEAAFKAHARSVPARSRDRYPAALGTPGRAAAAKVSIHVPIYDEPPAMVIETLDALAALEYPAFEVIVVDNNTRDEARWRPVEAHCERLGPRFRFFHVAPLDGFKAGALNFALERTSRDTDVVAVVDSDYRVEPDWLSRLGPHFDDPGVALVQAPQDYRDQRTRPFKFFCEAEYRGFFRLGMVTRNERNAIIQHGTMTMIRASALRAAGGWAEWTVTEDAELGLRILAHGYEAVYTTESFGRGLTPDRFRDYRSQRYRWALGAVQILRRHGAALIGREPSGLTAGQRFHFLTGWAGWLGDGLNLVFNAIAIGWSALMIASPERFFAPVATFSVFVLGLFLFKLVKMAWLYRRRVGATTRETLAAIVAGLSLVYISGRAVLAGLWRTEARFVRTPKLARSDTLLGALACVAGELLLAVALAGSATGVAMTAPFETIDERVWVTLLGVFAVPHIAAVSLSLLGALPARTRERAAARMREAAAESRQG